MSTNEMKWSIPAMEQGLTDIQQGNQKLVAISSELQTTLAPMLAIWEGEAKDTYQVAQKHWNDAMTAVQEALQKIATALDTAIGIHSTGEQSIVSSWQL